MRRDVCVSHEGRIGVTPDAVISREQSQEALSVAYVRLVAALAGYTVAKPEPDMDGIDLQIRAGGRFRPMLDCQLKATTNLRRRSDDVLTYPLPVDNYRQLRDGAIVSRLLVILDLPRDEAEWLTISREQLALKRCAYWVDLTDHPPRDNTSSVTVEVPNDNLFDVDALTELMEQSRQRSQRRNR